MIYKPWQREDDRTTGDSQRCYLDTRKPFHLEYLPVLEPQLCICASFLWVLFNCWFFSLNLLPFLQLSAFPFVLVLLPLCNSFLPNNIPVPAVERSPVRNIQVYNPTTNTLNVRWEAATGPVQQYRVVYSPLNGARPSESVSFQLLCGNGWYVNYIIRLYLRKLTESRFISNAFNHTECAQILRITTWSWKWEHLQFTVQLLLKALGLLTKRIGASVFACVHFLPFGLFCVNKCLSFKHVH